MKKRQIQNRVKSWEEMKSSKHCYTQIRILGKTSALYYVILVKKRVPVFSNLVHFANRNTKCKKFPLLFFPLWIQPKIVYYLPIRAHGIEYLSHDGWTHEGGEREDQQGHAQALRDLILQAGKIIDRSPLPLKSKLVMMGNFLPTS